MNKNNEERISINQKKAETILKKYGVFLRLIFVVYLVYRMGFEMSGGELFFHGIITYYIILKPLYKWLKARGVVHETKN